MLKLTDTHLLPERLMVLKGNAFDLELIFTLGYVTVSYGHSPTTSLETASLAQNPPT